jgi:hypothetical protein
MMTIFVVVEKSINPKEIIIILICRKKQYAQQQQKNDDGQWKIEILLQLIVKTYSKILR